MYEYAKVSMKHRNEIWEMIFLQGLVVKIKQEQGSRTNKLKITNSQPSFHIKNPFLESLTQVLLILK
jgi:hypothetical protein